MTDLWGREQDEVAIERIRQFCPDDGYYVAFSGGKDSIVSLDLVKRSGVPYDAHYNITGIDPPELFYFIRDQYPEVARHRPEKTMWALILKYKMPPTQRARYCCAELKERGGMDRRVVTGIRWEESSRRSKRKMVEACFRDSRKTYLHPIIDWSSVDVWTYIHKRGLPYPALYAEGFKRIGCIMCPMNTARSREITRWPRYYRKYLKAFDKLVALRAERGLASTANWSTGEAMMEWWLSLDKHRYKADPDQTVLFE